jgi:hypothetical protein
LTESTWENSRGGIPAGPRAAARDARPRGSASPPGRRPRAELPERPTTGRATRAGASPGNALDGQGDGAVGGLRATRAGASPGNACDRGARGRGRAVRTTKAGAGPGNAAQPVLHPRRLHLRATRAGGEPRQRRLGWVAVPAAQRGPGRAPATPRAGRCRRPRRSTRNGGRGRARHAAPDCSWFDGARPPRNEGLGRATASWDTAQRGPGASPGNAGFLDEPPDRPEARATRAGGEPRQRLDRSYGWFGCRDRRWPALSRRARRRFLTTCAG